MSTLPVALIHHREALQHLPACATSAHTCLRSWNFSLVASTTHECVTNEGPLTADALATRRVSLAEELVPLALDIVYYFSYDAH